MPGAPSSVLVTTSKAPVTTSVALVTSVMDKMSRVHRNLRHSWTCSSRDGFVLGCWRYWLGRRIKMMSILLKIFFWHLAKGWLATKTNTLRKFSASFHVLSTAFFLPVPSCEEGDPWFYPPSRSTRSIHLQDASNKCIASSNKCLTSSNKKLVVTRSY